MENYVFQILGYQFLFLTIYQFVFRQETLFSWNRAYLIITHIVSLCIPFIRIPSLQTSLPEEMVIQLPTVFINPNPSDASVMLLDTVTIAGNTQLTTDQLLLFVYIAGVAVSLSLLVAKLGKIYRFILRGKSYYSNGNRIVLLPNSTLAFSFFNTIFLGENISDFHRDQIESHERIHIQQKHSLDLLLFEVLRIVFWFNPFVYLYQKKLVVVQEYLTDKAMVNQGCKKQYYQLLLSQVFETESISFINTFFNQSLIKKRIVMLQKSKSGNFKKLKYISVLPLLFFMVVYSSCTKETAAQSPNQETVAASTLLEKIEDLKAELSQKESLTPQEKKALYSLTMGYSEGTLHKDSSVVPYAAIDKVPVYPGCTGDQASLKKCMTQKISEFVVTNFNTKVVNDKSITGKQRIAVMFKIDKEGKIIDIKAKSKSESLTEEAKRVVAQLPTMEPGVHNGKQVTVQYALPIVFQLD